MQDTGPHIEVETQVPSRGWAESLMHLGNELTTKLGLYLPPSLGV